MKILVKNIVYNIFDIPFFANTNKPDGLPTREHSTYNCPSEKHNVLKFKLQTDIVELRLIDGHCKCQSNLKLKAFKFN